MKDFFKIKEDRLTDKAFVQSMVISVLSILLCIILLCSLTFAWFNAGVSSNSNTLQSGHFGLVAEVLKQQAGEGAQPTAVETTTAEDGKITCTLGPGTYTITLKMSEKTNVTKGYCHVTLGTGTTGFATGGISKSPEYGENPFTFTVTVTEDNTALTLEPVWGIPANADVAHGESWPKPANTENANVDDQEQNVGNSTDLENTNGAGENADVQSPTDDIPEA